MKPLVTKSDGCIGDRIIYINGQPVYKKWPDGSSIVFEKYGPNTTNKDRDAGNKK